MVQVTSGWRVGSWGQCCRVAMEVGEVVGRIGCVAVIVVGSGGCYCIAEIVGGYGCVVGMG
jgi:hypothetical protein